MKELTARLSQTVEKLDRVQRVGSDRIVVSTASFPKEVVEQQTELVEDLRRAVEMWENMQIGCGLGRLEMELSDLSALFEEHFRPEEPEVSDDLEEPPVEVSDQDVLPAQVAEPAEDARKESEDLPAAESESPLAQEEVCPLRPPEILNLTEANENELQRCVEQQDTYIDYLSARLQRAAEKKTALDWNELAGNPEKLKNQLEFTAAKILQSRHLAEFELALQRTRLKRKERNLKKVSEELDSIMQSSDRICETGQAKEPPGGRRWMRMLGMGKPDSE